MNVRFHAALFQGVVLAAFLGQCLVLSTIQTTVNAFPIESFLEGIGAHGLSPLSAIARIAAIVGLWLGGMWFLLRFLQMLFERVLPARCRQAGCRGHSRLIRMPNSYVYACDVCGDVYDTHFRIGGDD